MDYTGDSNIIGPDPGSTYIDTPDVPLVMRMIEHMPGLATSIGFGALMRGGNTMLYGGFMDANAEPRTAIGRKLQSRRAERFAIMRNGNLSTPGAGGFYGGVSGRGMLGRRAQRAAAAGKTPFLRSARLNNMTARPRALTRFHSMSVFSGAQGVYSPFAGATFLGNTKFGTKLMDKAGLSLEEGQKAFGPGLLSSITAAGRVDRLQIKGSTRAMNKLNRIDQNLLNLAKMNNPGMLVNGALPSFETLGARGNLYASSLAGQYSQYAAGYFRGAAGFGAAGNLSTSALSGAMKAEGAFASAFKTAFGEAGFKGFAADSGADFLRSTAGKNIFKQLGTKGTLAIARSGGAGMLAARGAAMAIPGLNVLATASLVYDLGQMAGEVVKSGINLVRDANRSLQGSIAKPTFGMGYKDTEAAATSRARGVQAIQNSRLNARSLLGSEAAMMAAHYG